MSSISFSRDFYSAMLVSCCFSSLNEISWLVTVISKTDYSTVKFLKSLGLIFLVLRGIFANFLALGSIDLLLLYAVVDFAAPNDDIFLLCIVVPLL